MKSLIIILLSISLTSCACIEKQNLELAQEQQDSIRAYKLYNLALAYNLQGNDALALPLYDSAIILIPNDPDFYNNRGLTRQALEDTIGAINDFYKAIKIDSLDATPYANLGALYSYFGDFETSMKYAKKAEKLDSAKYIIFNLAHCQYMLGYYEDATTTFLKYLKDKNTQPQDKIAFYFLGNCYFGLNNMYDAQRCWDKANELAGYDYKAEMDKTME